MMKLTLDTLATTSRDSVGLHHGKFRSTNDEDILLLMAIDGSPQNTERLYHECEQVIENAMLNNEGTAEERLDGVLKELNGLIKGLLLSKVITDVQALLVIVDRHGMLYVSHAGRAEAYVVRSGAANQITEYSKGKPTPAFIHIASGQLETADTVVCSTDRLLRAVTPATLVSLSKEHTTVLSELKRTLEAEQEQACMGMIHVHAPSEVAKPVATIETMSPVASTVTTAAEQLPSVAGAQETDTTTIMGDWWNALKKVGASTPGAARRSRTWYQKIQNKASALVASIKGNGPIEGKKLHLLILAGVIAIFLIIWLAVNISTFAQSRQTKAQLSAVIESVEEDLRNADNRRLTGDTVSAIAILERAEENIKTVINDPNRLFIAEATALHQTIQTKREEVSNIVRRSPILVANLADKKSAVQTVGLIGKGNETFVVYDKQDSYKVISNTMEDAKTVSAVDLITIGTNFERFDTELYSTNGNSIIEITEGKPLTMKTDDEKGWISGVDMETFNRFLYVLAPDKNQIFKYERLSNRYGFPVEYNVNGVLNDALDMTIDFFIYVLRDEGSIVKLSSGEAVPFAINQAPEGLFANVTKIYKVPKGKLYALDPTANKVIVLDVDKDTGNATYLRQFILESDQITGLNDLYVDADESWLYVLDEKRLFKLELSAVR